MQWDFGFHGKTWIKYIEIPFVIALLWYLPAYHHLKGSVTPEIFIINKYRLEKIEKIRRRIGEKDHIMALCECCKMYKFKEEINMDNCIFCKITKGEIPSATLYEDENFRVILDLGPASKGHALILPKSHAANIYEISDEMAAKAMVLAKKMAKKMTEALECDGFNIVQNNGEIAGQTVFHFHMHLIPRYENDDAGFGWNTGELSDADKEDILSKMSEID